MQRRNTFKEGIVPLKSDDKFEEQQTSKKINEKEPLTKPTKNDVNELNECITQEKNRHRQKITDHITKNSIQFK